MNKSGKHRKKRDHLNAFALFPWRCSLNYATDFDSWQEMEKWCEDNLEDDWTAADAGIYIYEESDAVAFKLRWA